MTVKQATSLKWILSVLSLAVLAGLSFSRSLTGDEALTVTLAGGSFGNLIRTMSLEIHVPGYHVLLWLWTRAFGNSLAALRVFAFLPVGFLVWMGRRHFPRHGFLVLGASPFLLHLAVELRMYGLMAAAGMGILISLRRLSEGFSRRGFLLLLFFCVAGVWTHHFAWPGVAAACVVLFRGGRKRESIILLLLTLLAFSPWVHNMGRQVHRFDPFGESADFELFQLASPAQRVLGAPFSMLGTLLRFSSGTAAFRFDLFSVKSFSPWAGAGLLLFILSVVSAWLGRKTVGPGAILILAFVLLPLSYLRPGARHFSLAYPVFAALVAAGLDGSGALRRLLRGAIPALSLVLCVPFVLRSTMPQRCTYDRDFREAALVAGTGASLGNGRLVLFLDNFSTMGVLYHLEDEGFSDLVVIHPHQQRFAEEWYIYTEHTDMVSYLLQNTDSLVQQWGAEFHLLANNPRLVRGPTFERMPGLIGIGTDMLADIDLMDCLERHFTVEMIPLPRSQGPFSLFHVSTAVSDE